MEKKDQRFLLNIAFDISQLSEWNDMTKEGILRQGSTILRRLLIHREYPRAWRMVGFDKQPKVKRFNDLDSSIGAVPDNARIVFSQGGGGTTPIGQLSTFIVENMPNSVDPNSFVQSLFQRMSHQIDAEVWLSQYLSGTCLIISGQKVSREELIKFVANKMGGAHTDESLDNDGQQAMFDTMNNYYVGNHPHFYHEILSIGQGLVQSSDTQLFMKRLADLGIKW